MLDGVRVVDLSDDVAGGYGTRLFATYGADVIKVEPPDGDPTRRMASIRDGDPEASVLFGYVNAGKRSVVLDAGDPAERTRLWELLLSADVVVESGAPGAWRTRGVDFAKLLGERPSIVVCSVTPFGQDGPRAQWRTTALTAFASGGQMMLCGEPELPPLKTAGHQAYYQGGLHVFSSCMTALFGARRTGRGEWIDISMQEAQAASLEGFGPAAMTRETDSERAGNQARAIWGIYECADGYVGLASMARQTASVYRCIGQPQWAGDPAFANLLSTSENNDLVAALIAEWVGARTAKEVYAESDRHRAPFALIPTARDLLDWEPFRASGFWREVDHPVLGRHSLPSGPFAIDGDRGLSRRAPLLGEHTGEVVGELQKGRPVANEPRAREALAPLLFGLRVLDLTQVWAGPYAARFLADMGADVIHIEGPTFPDAVRAVGRAGVPRAFNTASYFNEYNRNKRDLVLDLHHPAGMAAFKTMVRRADIVMENWSVGVAEGLGIGYEELRAINPRVVMVQMPGFSQDGPEATRVGFGPSIEQMGGIVSLQGYPGGPPHKSGISYGDPVGGVVASGAIALALLEREKTGQGSKVVVFQRDNVIGLVGEYLLAESIGRPLATRLGSRDIDFAPHNVYQAADDEGRAQLGLAGGVLQEYSDTWVTIAVDSDEAWQRLVRVVDDSRLEDPRYDAVEGRRADEDRIDAILGEWVCDQEAEACAARLQAAGVSAMPVLSPLMLVRDTHLNSRGYYPRVVHPDAGVVRTTHPVWRLQSRVQPRLRPAPGFGEHNAEVLRELAGLSDREIEALSAAGVIAEEPLPVRERTPAG
jgi:crotonobetainyl-CoA:carnitine CoA-transferase CaiB-like acyl-CoA transferase